MVYVVTVHASRNVNDQMVHVGVPSGLLLAVCEGPDGIKSVGRFLGIPFVLS